MKSKFITIITVIDPDTSAPVDVEIRKLENGAMVGLDGSFLEQDVGPVYSPYDWNTEEIEIPDDEGTKKSSKVIAKLK